MKKEISPAVMISVIAAIVVVLGLAAWKVFFASDHSRPLTHTDVEIARNRKETKDAKGETNLATGQENR